MLDVDWYAISIIMNTFANCVNVIINARRLSAA